jgi:DDE superfamily endonuclease
VAISISNCYIVHINGPFIAGSWPDLRIARSWLHSRLRPHEFYVADKGYKSAYGPAIMEKDVPQDRREEFRTIRARHETINRRFKEFGILGNTYHHEEEKHGEIFRCIAVLVQIDIEHGKLSFQI